MCWTSGPAASSSWRSNPADAAPHPWRRLIRAGSGQPEGHRHGDRDGGRSGRDRRRGFRRPSSSARPSRAGPPARPRPPRSMRRRRCGRRPQPRGRWAFLVRDTSPRRRAVLTAPTRSRPKTRNDPIPASPLQWFCKGPRTPVHRSPDGWCRTVERIADGGGGIGDPPISLGAKDGANRLLRTVRDPLPRTVRSVSKGSAMTATTHAADQDTSTDAIDRAGEIVRWVHDGLLDVGDRRPEGHGPGRTATERRGRRVADRSDRTQGPSRRSALGGGCILQRC